MKPTVGVVNIGNRDTFFKYRYHTIKLAPGQKTTKVYKEELLVLDKKNQRILR